ncbi:TPA: EamA family transporter [Pseudomonas putida]
MSTLLLMAVLLLTCVGQIAQKFTARLWDTSGSAPALCTLLRSPWPWLAASSLGLGLGCWLLLLRHTDVGVAYPMLSLNFVLVAVAGHYLFGEVLTRRNLTGIALITSGVMILGAAS